MEVYQMNKIFMLLLCLGMYGTAVYVTANNEVSPYEETYPEIGYKTVEEALNDLEMHYQKKLKLPLRVPPIAFTHHFGRFSNLNGDINDSFEVIFISNQLSENHYKINVRPVKYKIPIKDKYVIRTLELKSGEEAIYMTISGFNELVFEKDEWQYMLGIDKRISDPVTPEVLVDIANSIEYTIPNSTK